MKGIDCHLMALDIYERILPEGHPHLAFTYNLLAFAYEKKGDYDSSADYRLTAINIYERILPPSHPRLIASRKLEISMENSETAKKRSEYLQKTNNARNGNS